METGCTLFPMTKKKPQVAPEPDKRWSPNVTAEWYAIWEDVEWADNIRTELHIPNLRRLFTYKHRWYAINDTLFEKETPLLVTGSRSGSQVINPLFSELRQLEETILRMEKEFGMTLRSASLISLDLGQGAKTWAELQQMDKRKHKAMEASKERSALPVVLEVVGKEG